MAVEVKVVRLMENDYVQVDTNSKKLGTRHYKVPQNNCDFFSEDYKSFEKSATKISTWTFIPLALGGALGCCGIANLLKAGGIMKTFASVLGALAGTICSNIISANIITNRENQLLAKNQAEKLYFDNTIDKII